MGDNNNRFDDEFKASAIKMVVEKGRVISAVSKDLKVSEPALRRWGKVATESKDS
jgi:transposase